MGDSTEPEPDAATATTALGLPAPRAGELDAAVARARAEAALFGDAAPVTVGRYRVIERAGEGGMGVVWSAWDPELGRGVALKLASSGDARARARARDEGRALARLSHPNVVPIYDVIEHDAGVFLVMELVTGRTLRELADGGATAMQLVRAYRQAGAGLAAAHAAGLIHRDFKPGNAILGGDGRVRVLDFGLAHEVSADGASPATIAGTPKYMAPEQRTGEPLTAAVDQYALCVALRESIARTGPVPRWLQPIVTRGTADKPGDRYPSIDALLVALAGDPATRWRRRGVIGLAIAVIAAAAIAFTVGRSQQTSEPSCRGGPARIAPSWNPTRKAAVTRQLAELRTPYAADAAPHVLDTLDGYAAGWVTLYHASCQAHRRGEISAALLDRRAGCLDRRRAALATVGELASTITADALPNLVIAIGELPALEACEDDGALIAAVAPPPPSAAAQAGAIADAIARVDVERDAGRLDDAARDADGALDGARALAYRPLIARALVARGRVRMSALDGDRGAADFRAATRDAMAAGDEPLAIEAFARAAFATATGQRADPAAATSGLDLIEALVERAGDRARFARALLHHNVGVVALARGDRDGARVAFEQARRESVGVEGSGAVELTVVSQSVLLAAADDATRRTAGAELIATRTRLLGAHHPDTVQAKVMAAEMTSDPATARPALDAACRELAEFHPRLGNPIAECSIELTWMAMVDGDRDAALAAADRVLAAADRGAAPRSVVRARGYRQLATGDTAAAAATFAGATAQPPDDARWWVTLAIADAEVGAALADTARDQRDLARAALDRAAAAYDRIAAAMPPPTLARRRRAIATIATRLTGSP